MKQEWIWIYNIILKNGVETLLSVFATDESSAANKLQDILDGKEPCKTSRFDGHKNGGKFVMDMNKIKKIELDTKKEIEKKEEPFKMPSIKNAPDFRNWEYRLHTRTHGKVIVKFTAPWKSSPNDREQIIYDILQGNTIAASCSLVGAGQKVEPPFDMDNILCSESYEL